MTEQPRGRDERDGRGAEPSPESLRSSWGVGRAHRTLPDDGRAMRVRRLLRRIRRTDLRDVIRKRVERFRAWRERRRTRHPTDEKRPVFIVGCNRSGTNMVCAALGNSPHGWAYQESEFSPAFNAYYLRPDWILERLIRYAPAPIVAFGGILDSQFTDDLLARFAGSRALWVYRGYEDVANSCARKRWDDHFKNLARWVANGELERLGSRGRRVTGETVRLFGDLFREDLSREDYACLYWYLRNQIYFDLELHEDPRVLIVQYEDAVLDRERAFRRVFDFVGFPYDPAVVQHIYASSVNKHPWPGVEAGIREVCEDLQRRLDAEYAGTSEWTPEGREARTEAAAERAAGAVNHD